MAKILYVITKSNWGGAQRYVYDLATGFKNNNEVSVVLGGDGILKKKLAEAGVCTISLPQLGRDISLGKDFSALVELVTLLLKEKPDVVHLNSSKIGLLGSIAARFARVPKIIFTGHGWAFNENRGFISKLTIKILHWVTILLCDTTIAVSHKTESDVSHFPFVKRKITLLHNGIGTLEFISREESRAALATLGAVPAPLWIGTISELHKNKGIEYMIRALAEVKKIYDKKGKPLPISFTVIGEGEERAFLEALVVSFGLERNVRLAGFISDASRFLRAFDIFTLTSITEALPYVLPEAGCARQAIIASRVGGIPEIITNGQSGILTEPRDVAAITEALITLIEHPDTRALFGHNVHQKVTADFSLEKMLRGTEEIYRS